MLIDVQGIGRYRMLGETRDDAAGEAFDKSAKLLACHILAARNWLRWQSAAGAVH